MSFVSHNFVTSGYSGGQFLQDQTPTQGAGWDRDGWATTSLLASPASRMRAAGTSSSIGYHVPTAPTIADYRVNLSIRRVSATDQFMGVKVRHDGGAGANWVHFGFNDAADQFELVRVNGGSPTPLDDDAGATGAPAIGTDFTVSLYPDGDTYHCYVNDALIFSYDDSGGGASRITVAGYPGIFASPGAAVGDAVGLHANSFEALNESELGSAPTAPSGCAATALSAGTNRVTWTDNSADETSFVVERAPDSAGSPGAWTELSAAVAASPYDDSTATPGTAYWYRVKARNASGDSAYSTTGAAVTTSGVVASEPVAFTEDEQLAEPPDTTIWVYSTADFTEDEQAVAGATVRTHSAAAFTEDEQLAATGASAPQGVEESEPVAWAEDEVFAASAIVRVYSSAAFVEDEAFAAAAAVRVYGAAGFTEDEALSAAEPDIYSGPLSVAAITRRPALFATITRRP